MSASDPKRTKGGMANMNRKRSSYRLNSNPSERLLPKKIKLILPIEFSEKVFFMREFLLIGIANWNT